MQGVVVVAFVSLTLASGPARGQEGLTKETKQALDGLPALVREAVKQQTRGATLRGVAKEVSNGVTLYEVETTVKGRTRDLMLDSQGQVVSVEEQTTLDEIPEPARAAILKAVGTGNLALVEKVTRGQTTFYDGHIKRGRIVSEVKVDAKGHPVE